MKKLILTLILLINTIIALTQTGYALTGNNIYQNRTEIYKANSPTNNSNNRTVYSYMNVDSSISVSWFQIVKFSTLKSPGQSFVVAESDGTLVSKSFYSVIDTSKLATKYFSNLTYQPIGNYLTTSYAPTWTSITGKPSFFDGNYNNLTNKPDLSIYTNYSDTTAMLSKYLLKSYANTLYQAKGTYLTTETDPVWLADSTNYLKKSKASTLYQAKGNYTLVSDTSGMLNKYALKSFTNTTYQLKGNYVNVSDTSTMLSKYALKSFSNATYQLKGSYVATTDTAGMLSKYALKSFTNATYQLKGTYLTSESDPVWLADSTNYLRKTKASATYQLKGNYLTPTDTTSLSNRINKKVSISDTTAMLNKYLLKSTASATYQPKGTYLTTEVDPTVPTHVKSITSADITRWDTQQTLSVSGQTLSISNGNSVTLPTVDAVPAMASRSFNTNFTLANTTLCVYSIKILNGTTLISASSAYAYLEYSTNSGTSWTTVSSVSREENGLSLISIATKGNTMTLTGVVPAGALTRIRTTVQTGSSIELITSQETKL